MPHDYSPKQRRYRDPSGKPVTRQELRGLIQKLTDFVAKEAARIATRYQGGKINLTQFELDMRELLKSGHIVAASVGRGGRERMTQSDWAVVGNKIKWQYGYLSKFARKVGQGKIAKIATANRAKSYATAIYISFANANRVAQTEFIKGGGDPNPKDEMLCIRELHAKESCPECSDYAAEGWIPVSEQPLLGELQCGDYCLCTILFADEVEGNIDL